jgi:hypothetical protein
MPNPPSRLRRGSFFKSYRGRSAFDVDDDEFDSAQKYSIASITKDGAVTPAIEPWKTRSRRSVSPYPLPYTSPTSKLRGRDLFASFSGRSPFDADDDEFDTARKYTIEESSAVPTTRARKISWADQAANPASSDLASEQAALGSKDDDGSSADKSGSTLSFTSTFDSASVLAPPVPAARPQGYKTIRKAEGKLMSATLASARSISPYKGNMWDPEEEEWGDASKVVETFKASYKTPAPRSPTKAGALSYFGTAIQSTVKSALSSPTKKAKDEEMRLEEEVWEKVEELVNPYYWNPEGDTVDDVMRGVFLSSTRFFPSQQPDSPRNTHLIDLGAYFESTDPLVSSARPRLCDAIGTVLSHTSKECLEAFLDPSTKEFIYRRKVDSNEGGLILIIRREGNEVVCGTYHNFAFKKLWKLYVKSIISVTGQWHEVFATAKPGEMIINKGTPEWGTIQPETPVVKSGESCSMMVENTQRKLELSPVKKAAKTSDDVYETNPKFMLCQSRVLATHLLWDIWYRSDRKYECRATWSADGEESIVRLKRALVGSEDEDD